MKPYYQYGGIAIYHGDCRDILYDLAISSVGAEVLVTDPPYGIDYSTGMDGRHSKTKVEGDSSAEVRDEVLAFWGDQPALVFGSWRIPHPAGTKMLLIWEKGEHTGMGDLALPWKPNHEEIYVLGSGFCGKRDGSVLRHLAVAGCVGTRTSRFHPTEKPLSLMTALISKCPENWVILDPFMGSGTTLVAAKLLGRQAIGIEIEERYCEIAASRLAQEVLPLARRLAESI